MAVTIKRFGIDVITPFKDAVSLKENKIGASEQYVRVLMNKSVMFSQPKTIINSARPLRAFNIRAPRIPKFYSASYADVTSRRHIGQ